MVCGEGLVRGINKKYSFVCVGQTNEYQPTTISQEKTCINPMKKLHAASKDDSTTESAKNRTHVQYISCTQASRNDSAHAIERQPTLSFLVAPAFLIHLFFHSFFYSTIRWMLLA